MLRGDPGSQIPDQLNLPDDVRCLGQKAFPDRSCRPRLVVIYSTHSHKSNTVFEYRDTVNSLDSERRVTRFREEISYTSKNLIKIYSTYVTLVGVRASWSPQLECDGGIAGFMDITEWSRQYCCIYICWFIQAVRKNTHAT